MRLRQIHIERFGHFANRVLDLDDGNGGKQPLVVVFGPNEAGKSTILEAVRSLLFGMEKKNPYAFQGDDSALAVAALAELSDGTRVRLHRSSGKGATLRGEIVGTGELVDDEWLHMRLSRPTRLLYQNVFGFSLSELASGGKALEQHEIKNALFAGGLGAGVRPDAVLDGLRVEAGKIFKERGSEQSIAKTMRRLEERRKQLKELVVRADVYGERERVLTEAKKLAEDRAAEARHLREQSDRQRALQDGLEPFGEMRAAREELAGLDVSADLPSEVAAKLEPAMASRDRLEQETRDWQTRLAELRQAQTTLVVDERLMAQAASIERLFSGLLAYRRARDDEPKRKAELEQEYRTVRARLAALQPGWDLDRLRSMTPSETARADMDRAIQEHNDRRIERSRLEERRGALETILATARTRLASLPPAMDVSRLRDRIEQWSGFKAKRDEARRGAKQLKASARAVDQQRQKLRPLWSSTTEDIAMLPVPPREQIDEIEEQQVAIDKAVEQKQQTIASRTGDLERLVEELQMLEAKGGAPSSEDLSEARQRRDRGWHLVRRTWLDGEHVEREAALFDHEHPLAEAYPRAVAAADSVADRMLACAEVVAQRLVKQKDREAIEKELADQQVELQEIERRRQSLMAGWQALWQPCGFVPRSPAVMRVWLGDRDALIEKENKLHADRVEEEELRREMDEYVQRLAQALGRTDGNVDPEELRSEAERRIESEDGRARDEEKCREQITSATIESQQIEQKLRAIAARQQEWETSWRVALGALGLQAPMSVEAARTVAAGLFDLYNKLAGEIENLKDRICKIERDIQEYEAGVKQLGAELGSELGQLAPDLVVESWNDSLKETRVAHSTRQERQRAIDDAEPQLARIGASLEVTNREIAALHARAGTGSDDELRTVVRQVERKRELRQRIERAEAALRKVRRTWQLEEFLQTLASTGTEAVRGEIERLEERAKEVEASVREADSATGAAQKTLDEIDGSGEAAARQAEIKSEIAALRDDVERYAVLVLAAAVLEDAIDRFQKEHQPAMLERTSALFAQMTGGRYGTVQRRMDGSLVAVRDDGVALRPEQLSTGTREQLYLAIRLAYVERYGRSAEPLPIVLDDVLANFDASRARQTLLALDSVARHGQVILFTCHEHIVSLAEQAVPASKRLLVPAA